jgi:hypothetical protein
LHRGNIMEPILKKYSIDEIYWKILKKYIF